MRIEQYFLVTDYSLWEVILNGDSPIPTRVVDGVVQPVAPTTAEQRFAKKNELKARGTLLMALPDKHQLKFNIHKDAKSLIEAIDKRNKTDLEDQSLDDLFNNLKIYEAEVKSSSSTSPTTQNIAFVSSQNTDNANESVSDVTSVSAASTKVLVSAIPNVDNLKMDLKWQMAMLTMRARRFLQKTGWNLGANGTTSIGFDMSKVECYNCHMRGHFARECSVMVLIAMIGAFRQMKNQQTMPSWHSPPQVLQVLIMRKSQFDVLLYKTGLESVEARIVVYQQNENVFEEDIKLLKLDVMLRDKDLVELRHKFEKSKQERDRLKLKLENFQTSSKNLSKLLASQISDKTGLGYDNQVFNNIVFDCDELISSKSDVSMPTSPVHDRYQSRERYNVVPPPYTGTFMPPKPDLVFHDAPTANETVHIVLNVEPKDESEGEPISTLNAPSFVHTSKHVKTPRTSVKPVEHLAPAKHLRKDIPKTRVTTVKANQVNAVEGVKGNWGNPQHALKDKGVIDSGCSRHMTGNISYFSDFKEVNKGYVAFGRTSKGGKITGKGKIRTGKIDFDDVYFVKELKFNLFSVSQMCDKKNNVLFIDTKCIVLSSDFNLPDENHVLLRVLRENNMYNVDLKNIVPSGDLTCLFANATLDESNLWHRRLGHVNFKTMNKLAKGNLVRGLPSKVFENNHTCVACKKGKQHKASWSGPTWLFDIDTLTQSMNYQPVVAGNQPKSSAGIQENLNAGTVGKEAKSVQQYVLLPLWSFSSKDPQNTYAATFEVKELESEVYVSLSSCDQTDKPDDKTIREDKGKNHVEFSTGVRYLSDAFKEFSDNSTNGVNAVIRILNLVENLHMWILKYPDDPEMLALEDITYSDDEEDVGAEADFFNLETNITEEGIDYKEVFAPVTRIEAIRLFLAYASFMGFMVYQMDVKSAFLYGTIKEEVYVYQPPGFEDPDFPDKVYKVVKALYGLHQALRAWYETLATYVLGNGFQREKIDQTLFIKKQKGDILLVQVYVDDIIFGSTNKDLCKAFEKLIKDKFQMSSIGELAFFLGLQVKQKQDGIFISQGKYEAEILRKFGLTYGKSASTPIDTKKPLLKDPDGEDVDVHTYRSMISSLMYLTSSRPDIMFDVCACVRFQVTPKASHLHAVKRIFRFLKGKPHLGLWYPKDSPFNLVAYFDSDYVGASLDRKSTIGDQTVSGKDYSNPLMADNLPKIIRYSTHHVALMKSWLVQKQTAIGKTVTGKENLNPFMADSLPKTLLLTFIHGICLNMSPFEFSLVYLVVTSVEGFKQIIDFLNAHVIQYALMVNTTIYVSYIKQFWTSVSIKKSNYVVRLQALIDRKKVIITGDSIRQAFRLDDADSVDCLPNEEIFVELARMGYEKPSTKLTFYKAFFLAQ
nr:putative ribonuclease H-like domain-containing protein [Tanacetum cinerariifolium]